MTSLDQLVDAFDPNDPAFCRDPYPVLGALREATPMFFDTSSNQWMITRFADVQAALRDARLGRIYHHRYSDEEWGRDKRDNQWVDFDAHEQWSLLSLEPPDHTRLRRMVAKVFTPTSVTARATSVVAAANALAAACRDQGEFDLLADFAQPFSVGVITDILGFPREDAAQLLDWSHRIVRMYELETDTSVKEAANDAAAAFIGYVERLISLKRTHPDDRLLSALVHVEVDGERLSTAEIVSTAMSLLEAGHEATVNTLGNGVHALLRHPDQWARLLDGSVEPRIAIEELLRWNAPLQLFSRWVLDDGFEVGGQAVEVGQQVGLLFGSAQRDHRRFDDPDTFDIARNEPSHIGFGGGIHFCVGAPLARQELAASLTALVQTMPGLRILAEPHYHPTFVIRGFTELRVASGAV